MKTRIFFLLALLVFCYGKMNAQTSYWDWVEAANPNLNSGETAMTIDHSGNIYVAGWYANDSITIGSYTLKVFGSGFYNTFLAKYDNAGNVLWAKGFGNSVGASPSSLATDNSGNVYLLGQFAGSSIAFGSFTLSNAIPDTEVIFLTKFDGNGNAKWAKVIGSNNSQAASISIDVSGNMILAGDYFGNSFIVGTDTLYNTTGIYNTANIFIAKYDSSGNVRWAKGSKADDESGVSAATIDKEGNIYLVGSFISTFLAFDTDTINNISYSTTLFLVKFDTGGKVVWFKASGNEGNRCYISDIAVDKSGNSYVTGSFDGQYISFDSQTVNNTSDSWASLDLFVAKYDNTGSAIWAEGWGDKSDDEFAAGITTDNSGNIFTTGCFYANNLTLGSTNLKNTSNDGDIYVAQLNSDGIAIWAKSAGGTGLDDGNSVVVDTNSQSIYLGGDIDSYSAFFGLDSIVNIDGQGDFFLAKLGIDNETLVKPEPSYEQSLFLFPNPCSTCYIKGIDNPTDLTITDLLGRTIEVPFTKSSDGYSIQMQQYANGIYIVHDKITGEAKKFVKD